MSGEKDVYIQRIRQDLLARQQQRERAIAEERARTTDLKNQVSEQLEGARERAAKAERASQSYRERIDDISNQLEHVSVERSQATRRLAKVKQQILEAAGKARQVHDEVLVEQKRLEEQLAQLAALESQLNNSLQSVHTLASIHDGSEALKAMCEVEALTKQHCALVDQSSALEAQLVTFAANSRMGTVIDELLAASVEHGYAISRSVASKEQVEFVIKNHLQETIRIACDLSNRRADDLTDDENLRLVLHGSGHESDDVCIADTVQILESLRKRGVAVGLTVHKEAGENPALSGERESSPQRNKQ